MTDTEVRQEMAALQARAEAALRRIETALCATNSAATVASLYLPADHQVERAETQR